MSQFMDGHAGRGWILTRGRGCRFLLGKLQVGEYPGLGHGQIPKFPKKEGGQDKVGRTRECLELDSKGAGLEPWPLPISANEPPEEAPQGWIPLTPFPCRYQVGVQATLGLGQLSLLCPHEAL